MQQDALRRSLQCCFFFRVQAAPAESDWALGTNAGWVGSELGVGHKPGRRGSRFLRKGLAGAPPRRCPPRIWRCGSGCRRARDAGRTWCRCRRKLCAQHLRPPKRTENLFKAIASQAQADTSLLPYLIAGKANEATQSGELFCFKDGDQLYALALFDNSPFRQLMASITVFNCSI